MDRHDPQAPVGHAPGTRARSRAAVLGHPIAHSLSPTLHRAAYESLGLADWRYDAVDVTEDGLAAFVGSLDDTWAGLSLTMPLKQTVLGLLDHVEPLAEVVGAVNTVLLQGSGAGRVLVGANTDVYGLVTALGEGLTGGTAARVGTAAVLGAGATAASTLAALGQLGCTTAVVYVRSVPRAGGLVRAAHRMGVQPVLRSLDDAVDQIGTADVVVSTLPPHAADDLAAALPGARPAGVLLDVAYDPRPTALSAAWAARGGVVVGGERMLLHQAVEQVRLMTGRPGPVDAMAAALDARLAS
ncbi:shikimate dehydrogenase [Cellulomonas chitinilytica]|nr:shikimate dehydrogenase [Cellulomonas chitinilytica]